MNKLKILMICFFMSACMDDQFDMHPIYETRLDNDLTKSYIRVFKYNQDGRRILEDLQWRIKQGGTGYYPSVGNTDGYLEFVAGTRAVLEFLEMVSEDQFVIDLHRYKEAASVVNNKGNE
jgi:hypothetical protein